MLIKATHTTRLSYDALISETVMELRMAPCHQPLQHRLSFELAIGPPTQVSSYFDWLGNTVHAFSIVARHRNVEIVATSLVDTSAPAYVLDKLDDTWPPAAPLDYAVNDFLRFDDIVCKCAPLEALARQMMPQRPTRLIALVRRMMDFIAENFIYERGVTTTSTALAEVLEHGRGVCQDFTHLLIGLARMMRIPARYVSGFFHPGSKAFRGTSESHAWCELYFPSVGWVAFDPTNACVVGENFVKVAVGRSYRDVPPHKGVYHGSAHEAMTVQLQTQELTQVPGRLVGERSRALDIPTYRSGPGSILPWTLDEQMQQQQQQQGSRWP